MIYAGIGRYGPFVNKGRIYANLESVGEVFTIGLNRAVTLIAEKEAKRGGGRNGTPGKPLGDHADLGAIELKAGRYGPYVTNGKINATIPRGTDPESIDLEQAAALISAKAESGGGKRKGGRRSSTK